MNRPALVSLTFDDGLRCQFEQAVPILDQYGFLATFFLVANTDPIHTDGCEHPDWRKINWSVQDIQLLKAMVQRGHEIGAHSVHHRYPFLDTDPKGEAENSKEWIEKRLDVDVPSYCYPFFHFTHSIKNAVINAGYKQARWGANESQAYYPLQSPIDHFKVDSRLISKYGVAYVGGHPVGQFGGENIGGWIRPDHWHVLVFHGIGTLNDGWWSIPIPEFVRQMAELAKHRDSGTVEVVTFNDGAERLRTTK